MTPLSPSLRARLFGIACLLGIAAAPAKATIWVSPDGDDAGPGTEEHPLRTIERARQVVRTLNRTMTDDLTVFIGGGTYRLLRPLEFDAEDSGTGGYSVIYTAAPDQHPILNGGVVVTGWRRVDPDRNLWAAPAPAQFRGSRQLYVNGVRARRARGRLPTALTETPAGYTAAWAVMSEWRNAADLEFVYPGGTPLWSERPSGFDPWTEPRCPVATIQGTAITMAEPCWDNATRRHRRPGPPSKRSDSGNSPVAPVRQPEYVENAYELLGTPGEWYFDRPSRMVYYVPRRGENPAAVDVEAPVLETILSLAGTADRPVQNLVFKGLRFENATCLLPSSAEGFAEIRANRRATGPNGYAVGGPGEPLPGNVRVVYANGVQFLEDIFTRLGGAGLEFGEGSQGDTAEGCVFADISSNGCEFGRTTGDNRIADCHFFNIGAEYHGAVAVEAEEAQRTRIEHNQIDHVPSAGILTNSIGGNVVADNLIFDARLLIDDDFREIVTIFPPSNGRRAGAWPAATPDETPEPHARNAGIEPSYRAILAETAGLPAVPDAPGRVAADPEDGFAYVTWSPPCFDGGSPILFYVVVPSVGEPVKVSAADFKAKSYVKIAGLADGRAYEFTVSAANARGGGVSSLPSPPIVPARRKRFTPPGRPAAAWVRVRDGRAIVRWEGPVADGGGPIVAYAVTVSPGGRREIFEGRRELGLGTGPAHGSGRTVSEAIEGVGPAKNLVFTVAAINAAGEGAPTLARSEP